MDEIGDCHLFTEVFKKVACPIFGQAISAYIRGEAG